MKNKRKEKLNRSLNIFKESITVLDREIAITKQNKHSLLSNICRKNNLKDQRPIILNKSNPQVLLRKL
jgi:hypothetical protein